jgi:ABC-type Fe3+/spermidine/putrescine transport system ATPase subunit
MTQVTLDSLSKTYNGQDSPALHALSLDIRSGELAALLGPSGSGKTSCLKIIAGLLTPSSGDLRFDGQPVLHLPPERRGAVMVFQNHLLFPFMSVADNIGFGLKMRKLGKTQIARQVAEMLELVRLPELGARRPAELSGGQQQRVALARALILRPRLLLLDEPLSNLDAHLRLEMRDLIRSLQQELGITTLFVTHDQEEAVMLADRVALILEGRLKQFDRPEAFYQRPSDQATAAFFGGRNFIPGTVRSGRFECQLGQLDLPEKGRAGLVKKGPGILTIRPENIVINPPKNAENRLDARLARLVYLGTHSEAHLQIGDLALTATAPPAMLAGLTAGAALAISLPKQALWLLPG